MHLSSRLLVTGGCGFIGTNVADYFARAGWTVTVLDNLSRAGSEINLAWLHAQHPSLRFVRADVRSDQAVLNEEVAKADCVIHLASQVAVTTSVQNPRDDFMINALGTLNMLEAVRAASTPPIFLYASTNKVYGGMEDVVTIEHTTRYEYRDFPNGIDESRPLHFHSPYGCSKGTGDQYVRDYARIYNLPTVVLRQSCIYGPHQFGVSDQGWLAWFMIAVATRQPLTIYGTGKQTRDVLYITDLIRLYEAALQNIDKVRGHVLNVGGGPAFSLSVVELVQYLEGRFGQRIAHTFAAQRPGDQACYISDISRSAALLDWQPTVAPTEGLTHLWRWVSQTTTRQAARIGGSYGTDYRSGL